jgi:hypothetical protein
MIIIADMGDPSLFTSTLAMIFSQRIKGLLWNWTNRMIRNVNIRDFRTHHFRSKKWPMVPHELTRNFALN